MALPYLQSQDPVLNRLQTQWQSQINPVLANPILSGHQISNVVIASGSVNIISHLLDRQMQGWFLVDINTPAKIARVAPFNSKTLTLSSDAAVTASIWVY